MDKAATKQLLADLNTLNTWARDTEGSWRVQGSKKVELAPVSSLPLTFTARSIEAAMYLAALAIREEKV
jgi:hypothetical protein